MNGLREKFRNKKGFTLIEMLIVVAIIAILIAVSIPLVSSSLESAREAVDAANERDAKSLAMVAYLTVPGNTDPNYVGIDSAAGGTAYYSITDTVGTLVKDKPSTGYGKGTEAGAVTTSYANKVIKVTVTPASATGGKVTEASVKVEWEALGATP